MTKLIISSILALSAVPAFAVVDPTQVPSPDALSLIGIGALAVLAARLRKK
jgi:hypothetical protein